MAEKLTLQDPAHERRIFLTRLSIGGGLALLLLGVLIARLVWLQIYQHEYYAAKSDDFRIHIQPVVPNRGLIYDRNGVLLAENRPSFSLMLVKEHAGDIDATLDLLRDLIRLDDDDVSKFRSRLSQRWVPYSAVPVRMNLNEEEIANVSVNQFRLPGVRVEAELVRHYPQGEAFAHALGYVASINEEELKTLDPVNYSGTHQIGKLGVEKFYEDLLHGQVGYETVEKNARGQITQVLDRSDPVPGKDLVLHLDAGLQLKAWDVMGDYRGAIVALDVKSGGVLAMVSKPGFDPNLFVRGISRKEYAALQDPIRTPLYNRALAKYAPGSTIKPFVGLAALDLGVRTRDSKVSDPGWFRLPGHSHTYHDWTWWVNRSGHGLVNLEKAIYQSCDIYFYDLAGDMGIDRMHDFLYQFGFGRNTSIDLPQASIGTLPSQQWKREALGQPWYPGETINSSIGQGYTMATPLQLATATMLLANHGKWYQPSMVKTLGLNGEPVLHQSSIPDVQLKNPDDWRYMAEAMEKVVHRNGGYRDNGTAYAYIGKDKTMAYHMAGKSGTAQVVNMSPNHDKNAPVPEIYRDHALFIAFAPVEDPQIAVAVFVQNGVGGSGVAGPMAREVIDEWLLRPGMLPSPDAAPPLDPGLLPPLPQFSAAGGAE